MACTKTELFYSANKYLITPQSGIRTWLAQMNSTNTGVLQIISAISVSAVSKFRIRVEKISSSKMGNIYKAILQRFRHLNTFLLLDQIL
jgi:hypothetical protein